MAVASTGYILIGKETSFGDAPARSSSNYKFYPAEEVEVMPGKEFIDFKEIRGSRQASITLDGPFRPTANMKGAFYPCSSIGLFLKGVFGDEEVTTNGSGNKVHTFKDGLTIPSFTIERATSHKSAQIVEQVTGCKVESLQLACAFGEKVNLTVQFQAGRTPEKLANTFLEETSAASFPTSMLPYVGSVAVDPLIFRDATIYVKPYEDAWDTVTPTNDQVAYMKSINLEFKNTITRQETLRGQNGQDTYRLFEGGFETTLSGTAVFETLDLYNAMLAGDRQSIKLSFENLTPANGTSGEGHQLSIEILDVKVSKASIPFKAGEVIESDVEFKVRFDQTAGKSVIVKLVNNESSAY